jgi:hypothetical protein
MQVQGVLKMHRNQNNTWFKPGTYVQLRDGGVEGASAMA